MMDKDRIIGGAKEIAGKLKSKVGEATGNEKLEAEGLIEQAEGKLQQGIGKGKDAIRDALDGK
jgi:uncharacterized protein YjbJ (UPF0337 family)